MDWPRIKTILILLFAVINLVLWGNIQWMEYEKFTVDDQTLRATVQVLQNNGVEIQQQLISPKRQVMQSGTVRFTGPYKEQAAKRLLGEDAILVPEEEAATATYHSSQGVLSLKDSYEVSYTSPRGAARRVRSCASRRGNWGKNFPRPEWAWSWRKRNILPVNRGGS